MTTVFPLQDEFAHIERLVEIEAIGPDQMIEQAAAVAVDPRVLVQNLAYMVRNREAALDGLDDQIERMGKRRARLGAEHERIKAYLLQLLGGMGQKKVVCDFLTVQAIGGKARVVVEDETKIPAEYWRVIPENVIPETRVVDRNALYEAMKKDGVIIDGASLQPTARIDIK